MTNTILRVPYYKILYNIPQNPGPILISKAPILGQEIPSGKTGLGTPARFEDLSGS